MGNRYGWVQMCKKCGAEIECWYAESCGVIGVTCKGCKEEYNIVLAFHLKPKNLTGTYDAG